MTTPFILCCVSPNGNVLVSRTDGQNPEVLAEHYEGAGFAVPMTIVIIDQKNIAARMTITTAGTTVLH
jgi:hypothetical protein